MKMLKFTYKASAINALIFVAGLFLTGCSGEVSEQKVRKSAVRSFEINNKYVDDRERKYTKMLEKRIKIISEDIEKLQDVSDNGLQKAGTDINSSLNKLITEKENLEIRLKLLNYTSAKAKQSLDAGYNLYEHNLDSVLRNLNTFLSSYEIDDQADKGK